VIEKKWPLYMGGIGTVAIFFFAISVSLAHTAIRILYLFLSPPIRALNTIRVSLTGTRDLLNTNQERENGAAVVGEETKISIRD